MQALSLHWIAPGEKYLGFLARMSIQCRSCHPSKPALDCLGLFVQLDWSATPPRQGPPGFSAKVLLSALSARGHFCEKPGSLSVALVPSGYAQLTMIVESSRAALWRLAASSPTVTS